MPWTSLPNRRHLALEPRGEVRPQPRVRLELEGVGRLVQGDPGPERRRAGTPSVRGRGPDVLLDEQEPAGRRLGGQQREVVLAEHALAHEPEQEAELAGRDPAVGEGHRRLGQAAADGHDLVEQVRLELADERRERRRVGPDPARPIDDAGALDDARQLGARAPSTRTGHDARHRLGVGRLGRPAARPGSGRPGALASRADGDPLDRRPVDESLAGLRSIRRPTTVAAAPSADPMRMPACQARSSRHDTAWPRRSARASRHAAREPPSSTVSTAGKSGPNRRTARSRKRSGSPVVASWRTTGAGTSSGRSCPASPASAAVPRVVPGASRPLTTSSSASADAVAVAESTIAMRSPTAAAMTGRSERVVRAAQQQRVDRRARRPREDRLAVRVALAEERRQRRRDRRLGLGPARMPGLDHRHERRRGVLVDLDRRVLVLDRREVGVRADRRRRGDDPDPPVAGRQRGRLGTGPDDPQDRAGRSAAGTPRCRPRWRCCRPRRAP